MDNVSALYTNWSKTRTDVDLNALLSSIRRLALRMSGRDEDIAQGAIFVIWNKLDAFNPNDAHKFEWWCRSVIARTRKGAERDVLRRREDEFVEQVHDQNADIAFVDLSTLTEFQRDVAEDILTGYRLVEIAGRMHMKADTLRQSLRRLRKAA